MPKSHNKDWKKFEAEVTRSLNEQSQLEESIKISFSEYLENYYK